MEFFISTNDAQRAIKLLSVTSKMNVDSFEGQVLIKLDNDVVTFISNNGSSGISCSFPVKVVSQGKVNVLYSKMKSFIMNFAPWDGEVGAKSFRFRTDSAKLKISVEVDYGNNNISKSNLTLTQMKASYFSKQVTIDKPNLIINSSIIKSAINKTLFATDPNSTVDFAKGIRMFLSKDKITFTAINGKIVSDYSVSNDSGIKDTSFFLTHSFLMGVRKILVDDTQFFFELTGSNIKLNFDNIIFWSKSIPYKDYPDYTKVFKKFDKVIEVTRDILISGLSSFIDILDPDDFNRVTIKVDNNKLFLETDKSLFEYPNLNDGKDFILDMDGRDVLNTLNAFDDDNIKLKCIDENNGMIFEAVGFENQQVYVVNLTRR